MRLRYGVDNLRRLPAIGLIFFGVGALALAGAVGITPSVQSAPRTYLDHEILSVRLDPDAQNCRPQVMGERVVAICGRMDSNHWAVVVVNADGSAVVRDVFVDGTRPIAEFPAGRRGGA